MLLLIAIKEYDDLFTNLEVLLFGTYAFNLLWLVMQFDYGTMPLCRLFCPLDRSFFVIVDK